MDSARTVQEIKIDGCRYLAVLSRGRLVEIKAELLVGPAKVPTWRRIWARSKHGEPRTALQLLIAERFA